MRDPLYEKSLSPYALLDRKMGQKEDDHQRNYRGHH